MLKQLAKLDLKIGLNACLQITCYRMLKSVYSFDRIKSLELSSTKQESFMIQSNKDKDNKIDELQKRFVILPFSSYQVNLLTIISKLQTTSL